MSKQGYKNKIVNAPNKQKQFPFQTSGNRGSDKSLPRPLRKRGVFARRAIEILIIPYTYISTRMGTGNACVAPAPRLFPLFWRGVGGGAIMVQTDKAPLNPPKGGRQLPFGQKFPSFGGAGGGAKNILNLDLLDYRINMIIKKILKIF